LRKTFEIHEKKKADSTQKKSGFTQKKSGLNPKKKRFQPNMSDFTIFHNKKSILKGEKVHETWSSASVASDACERDALRPLVRTGVRASASLPGEKNRENTYKNSENKPKNEISAKN
jgi:hypothetical protein